MKAQVNEIKISYKGSVLSKDWQKLKSSSDTAEFIYQYWDKDTIEAHESFKVLLLNNANKVKGIIEMSKENRIVFFCFLNDFFKDVGGHFRFQNQ